MAGFWEKISRVDASSDMGRVVFLCMVMAACTLVAILEMVIALSWAPLVAVFFGWVFVGVFALVQASALRKAGGAAGSVLVPSGDATPSVAQHSNIEALEMKGEYARAAAAYRAAIQADPADIVACEKLGQLALRQLKDYDTAAWAYHQAEQRATEPRRRVGYAMLALSILRDNAHDTGRTVVELRKLLERYPDVPNAAALRAELEQLKATLFEATSNR